MKYAYIFLAVFLCAYIAYELLRCVYLTHVSSGLVGKASPYQRNEGSRTMLVIGDSTAAGVGSDTPEHTVAGRLALALDASVQNFSKSGAVTADMQGQLSSAQRSSYDLILIQIGANDVIQFNSINAANTELDRILKNARKLSDRVVLLTAGVIGEAPFFPWFVKPFINMRTAAVRSKFMSTAEKNGVAYVDLFSIPDPFSSDPKRYYAPDGLHLTGDGWNFWFEQVQATVRARWPEMK